jgi:hypothetical protein
MARVPGRRQDDPADQPWKAGKTTLVALLLARMAEGGTLAGLPVSAGRAAVVSEEPAAHWDARCRKLHLQDHVSLFCRPFRNRPTPAQWAGLVEGLLHLHEREGLDLVVIDPPAVFLPGDENTVRTMMEGLLPLGELTRAGLSVLLLHHPRKGPYRPRQAARGSGALPGHVDILIEMSWYAPDDAEDRRRWLRSYSRHDETRRHLLMELTPAGDDYLLHERLDDATLAESRRVLRLVLEDADERLTQKLILEQWPEDFKKPDRTTIVRALQRGMEEGDILRRGGGRQNDPYRYWLAGMEDNFFPGPAAGPDALARWARRANEKQEAWLKRQLEEDAEPPRPEASGTAEGSAETPARSATVAAPPSGGASGRPPDKEALSPGADRPPKTPPPPVQPIVPPAPALAGPEEPAEPSARERRRLRRWPYG